MDTMATPLTEKQEQALMRMERLAELRRASRGIWRVYRANDFLARFFSPGTALYLLAASFYCHYFWPTTMSAVLLIPTALYLALSLSYTWFIVPMQRRIETLERLLEEEIKRSN